MAEHTSPVNSVMELYNSQTTEYRPGAENGWHKQQPDFGSRKGTACLKVSSNKKPLRILGVPFVKVTTSTTKSYQSLNPMAFPYDELLTHAESTVYQQRRYTTEKNLIKNTSGTLCIYATMTSCVYCIQPRSLSCVLAPTFSQPTPY